MGCVLDSNSIQDLQWAQDTLMRLISIVQVHGLINDKLYECVVKMTESAVMLEGLIQQQQVEARRRKSDRYEQGA